MWDLFFLTSIGKAAKGIAFISLEKHLYHTRRFRVEVFVSSIKHALG